jgi:signal transduction histidine kinase
VEPSRSGYFWAGASAGLCLAALMFLLHRIKLRKLDRDLARAKELAEVRQQERDSAQQELLWLLQNERELVKEKLQFDSQLSDFEKYASLAQLALGAAHEINNPLLGIMSHLELELRESTGEQRIEIEQCIAAARRISAAIQGLMNYARPDPLTLNRVNLHRLAAQALEFLGPHPQFRHLELHNCIPADLPEIVADANQISQVITNLLLNAAQATPPGGSITITAQTLPGNAKVEFRVRDTGTGVSVDILPHLFEPFFTTKRGTGTGLGLSICREIVRKHGGEIQLQSVPGAGTTVSVSLPIQQGVEPASELAEVIA